MAPFSGTDLVGAAAFSMALFSSILLLALLARAREDILQSPVGWRLVAAALGLFALRGFAHFLEGGWVEPTRHVAGIVAAALLPMGLLMVLLAEPDQGVEPDAAGD